MQHLKVDEGRASELRRFPLRARTLLLSLLLMVANIFWITVIEVRWYSLDVTSLPIFITPIFSLFIVVMVNRWLQRWRPQRSLSPAELLIVYLVIVTGAVFAGHDMLQNLFGAIGHAEWRATPESGWRERFFAYIPKPLFVWDMEVLRSYYFGGASPYRLRMPSPVAPATLTVSGSLPQAIVVP